MTTTPNLPPAQAAFEGVMSKDGFAEHYFSKYLSGDYCVEIIRTAWIAYQAGRDAGLDEAADLCDLSATSSAQMLVKTLPQSLEYTYYSHIHNEADELTDSIRALKSDAKGGI